MKHTAAKKLLSLAQQHRDEMLFIALGGVGEIGMNAYLYHYKDSWVLIDLGLGFADYRMPGIDTLFPDVSLFDDLPLDAVLLTHAHEDHIGALPQLLQHHHVPLYMGEFTAHLVEKKLGSKPEAHLIADGETFEIGALPVTPCQVAHSVPEAFAFTLHTDFGAVLHSGDWKYDHDPVIGSKFAVEDWHSGSHVLKAMVCDSTNIMVDGTAGSESLVSAPLSEIIAECKGSRIFITCFASNIARMNLIMLAAHRQGRKTALMGRAMHRMYQAGREMGWFESFPPPVAEEEIAEIPPRDLLILLTGSQGEGRSMLAKITRGEHKKIKIQQGDKVLFSSRTIPGNEIAIGSLQNQIAMQGGELMFVTESQIIHVSGHYQREEIAETYRTLKPEWVIPVHGEARHLRAHCQFASEMGIKPVYLPGNGQAVVIGKDGVALCGEVDVPMRMMEPGGQVLESGAEEFLQRKRIIWNGAVVLTLAVDEDDALCAVPQLTVLGLTMDEDLREDIESQAETLFDEFHVDGLALEAIVGKIETLLRKQCRSKLKKRPVVSVNILQVSS